MKPRQGSAPRIGILGGGQLGCMLAEAIHGLGGEVAFYDPDGTAPALRRFAHGTVGAWTDTARIRDFLAGVDRVTYEMEHVDLGALGPAPVPFLPSLDILLAAQDRSLEKRLLAQHGAPHVPFRVARSAGEIVGLGKDFGYPHVVKLARGGYDGKGQWKVRGPEQSALVAERLDQDLGQSLLCTLESFVDLRAEISVIVGRNARGERVTFPVFENTHRAHILDYTVLPARVPKEIASEAQAIAERLADSVGLVGLLTVEFFLGTLTSDDTPAGASAPPTLFVNELAPRPHNSGHITRRACSASQFDVLARILMDLPLLTPTLRGDAAYCMGNVLGEHLPETSRFAPDEGNEAGDLLEACSYGKVERQPRRKMGHLITRGQTVSSAVASMEQVRQRLLVTS